MPKPSKNPDVRKWWQKQRNKFEDQTRLKIGQSVITVEPKYILAGDWTEEALQERQYGVPGVIEAVRDSHGLCYEVRHTNDPDDSRAFYDPWELEVNNS